MKYNLAVLAVLKNETHVLKEWIQHYQLHGVEKFYLLDDNSDDDPYSVIAGELVEMRMLDPEQPKKGKQTRAYNLYLEQIRDECQYVIVVDLDEFLFCPYQRKLFPVIEEFGNIGEISCPWLNFGSSGYISQPKNVVPNFLWRREHRSGCNVLTKGILNVKYLQEFGVHSHNTAGKAILSNSLIPLQRHFAPLSEACLPGYRIRVNHYPIQSFEFFERVKMTRGSVDREGNPRTYDYFNAYDRNEIPDTTLRDLNWSLYDR